MSDVGVGERSGEPSAMNPLASGGMPAIVSPKEAGRIGDVGLVILGSAALLTALIVRALIQGTPTHFAVLAFVVALILAVVVAVLSTLGRSRR